MADGFRMPPPLPLYQGNAQSRTLPWDGSGARTALLGGSQGRTPGAIFDADTDAWYEPGQLPEIPPATPAQRAFQLDPALGMLPMIPGYQSPEEQSQERGLSPLPPVPSMKLDRPAMRPPAPYAPPSLDLGPIPGLGGMPALTTPPKDLAGALQAMPPTEPALEGFSWEGQSGRKFEITPEQRARLRAGYADMQKRMGGSLGPLAGLGEDPAGTASGLMAALSQFMEPEKAAQLALSVHSGELNRLSAEERAQAALDAKAKRAGSGGVPAGTKLPGKTERAMDLQDEAFVKDIRNNIQNVQGFRGMNEAEQAANKLEASASLKSGVADANAVKQMIRLTEDRISDSDMRIALQAGGVWAQLQALKGYVFEGGQRDQQYMREVADVARAMRAVIRQKKAEAAEQAERGVLSSPHEFIGGDASRRAWAEWVRGEVMGHSVSSPGGKAPAAAGDPNAAADALLEK